MNIIPPRIGPQPWEVVRTKLDQALPFANMRDTPYYRDAVWEQFSKAEYDRRFAGRPMDPATGLGSFQDSWVQLVAWSDDGKRLLVYQYQRGSRQPALSRLWLYDLESRTIAPAVNSDSIGFRRKPDRRSRGISRNAIRRPHLPLQSASRPLQRACRRRRSSGRPLRGRVRAIRRAPAAGGEHRQPTCW